MGYVIVVEHKDENPQVFFREGLTGSDGAEAVYDRLATTKRNVTLFSLPHRGEARAMVTTHGKLSE